MAKAVRTYRRTGIRCFGSWALLTAAKIQSKRNQEQKAEHIIRQAIDSAETPAMRSLLAHGYLALGKMVLKRENSKDRRTTAIWQNKMRQRSHLAQTGIWPAR